MTQTLTTKVLNDFITGQGYGVAPSAVEAMARELLANREAQPVACDIERIKRHALPAGECPKQSQVVLLSSLKRLLTAPPAPPVPDESDPRDAFESVFPMPKYVVRCGAGYAVTAYSAWGANDFVERWEGWNACRAAMLAQPVSSGYKLPADWRLDESTGAKILMYKDCSVIEDQQAEYVLSLIQAAAPVGGNG